MLVKWAIKGYHVTQIRPHPAVTLKVMEEDDNPVDPMAMKVVMPNAHEIDEELLGEVTRLGDNRRPTQRVRDTVGCIVGRVPANLCRMFRIRYDHNIIIILTSIPTKRT